ncbi:MAG: hypothetical protein ACE5NC_05295 [Anaerolineae bacterium]
MSRSLDRTHTLRAGARAPDFTLPGTITKPEPGRITVRLREHRGQKVLLLFYVAAFTGG